MRGWALPQLSLICLLLLDGSVSPIGRAEERAPKSSRHRHPAAQPVPLCEAEFSPPLSQLSALLQARRLSEATQLLSRIRTQNSQNLSAKKKFDLSHQIEALSLPFEIQSFTRNPLNEMKSIPIASLFDLENWSQPQFVVLRQDGSLSLWDSHTDEKIHDFAYPHPIPTDSTSLSHSLTPLKMKKNGESTSDSFLLLSEKATENRSENFSESVTASFYFSSRPHKTLQFEDLLSATPSTDRTSVALLGKDHHLRFLDSDGETISEILQVARVHPFGANTFLIFPTSGSLERTPFIYSTELAHPIGTLRTHVRSLLEYTDRLSETIALPNGNVLVHYRTEVGGGEIRSILFDANGRALEQSGSHAILLWGGEVFLRKYGTEIQILSSENAQILKKLKLRTKAIFPLRGHKDLFVVRQRGQQWLVVNTKGKVQFELNEDAPEPLLERPLWFLLRSGQPPDDSFFQSNQRAIHEKGKTYTFSHDDSQGVLMSRYHFYLFGIRGRQLTLPQPLFHPSYYDGKIGNGDSIQPLFLKGTSNLIYLDPVYNQGEFGFIRRAPRSP